MYISGRYGSITPVNNVEKIMENLELMVGILFAANAITTIALAIVIDHRITKIESRLRNKYRR